MEETKRALEIEIPPISAPPFQLLHSSSLIGRAVGSPIFGSKNISSDFSGSPTARPENSQDAWLPITESRNGNGFNSALHALNSGIGAQALLLPLAFTTLGWSWGIISLCVAFVWQLYTMWLLIQLHESESGTRYSRYLVLSMAAFGEKAGKLLALFPTMYLSGGTCVTLIMIGGATMKIFFNAVCGDTCGVTALTTVEWYLVFTCAATVMAQLPNLNSITGVSFTGAVTAITYCTVIWVFSAVKSRPAGSLLHDRVAAKSETDRVFSVLGALGIVAFAFRGHNLVLEIQGTMPSTETQPSRRPMWSAVKYAYAIIASCLFPLAIVGYWAYGNYAPLRGGLFNALYEFHKRDTSNYVFGIISMLVVIHCLSSYEIYAMPVFDNLERAYMSRAKKPCPRWVRMGFRVFFGCLTFFVAVALPFLPSLAGLLGGIALPITMVYPCFMWNVMKKPQKHRAICVVNWVLGAFGMVLSVLVVAAAIWTIVTVGIEVHFFKPK